MARKIKETFHRIGEILVRKQAASPEAIDEALAVQREEIESGRTPRKIGAILVDHKVLDKLTIREILQEQQLRRGSSKTFKIDLKDAHGIALLSITGRLDQRKSSNVTKVLERLMNRGFAQIAVDATKLSYMNSRGISTFISYIDESRARGGDIKFYGLGPSSRLVLQRLGLHRFIQIFRTKKDTLAAFNLPIDEYMSRGALGEYVAPLKVKIFHLSYCEAAQKLSEDDRTYFESKWHARNAGKRPCRKCKP